MEGIEYPVRDGTGEWGSYRPGTIEALAHVGKVTGEEEVQLSDGRWVPILTVAELRQAVTGEEAQAEEAAATAPEPPAAAPPVQPPVQTPVQTPATAAPTPAATAAGPAPVVPPGTTYEVIKGDGAMLAAMPLPLVIANIRDGNVGPDDLVAKAGSPWVPARDLPELSPGFAAGVRTGPTPEATGSIPAIATAAGTPPPPTPEAPQASASPPVVTSQPAAPPPAATAAPPQPQPAAPAAASVRDLASTPFGVVLGQLLRERSTGRLFVEGETTLTALFKDGHPIGAEISGGSGRAQTSEFMLSLGGEDSGPNVATAARSAAAVTDVLTAFQRVSGAWRFEPAAADQPPQFWVHPWELQRAGYGLEGWQDQVEGLTSKWGAVVVSLPGGAALSAMPLADGERVVLGMVDGARTFDAVVEAATAQGLALAGTRRTLLAAKNLGLATLAGLPDAVMEGPLNGETLFGAGRDPDWVIEELMKLDDAAVLGVRQESTEADIQAAYVRLVDCLKDFAGNSDVRAKVLQRINVAHRTMADVAKRRASALPTPQPAAPPPAAAAPPQPRPSAPAAAPGPVAGEEVDELEAAMQAAMASGAVASRASSKPSVPDDGRTPTEGRSDTRELMLEQNFSEAHALIAKSKWVDAQRILRRLVQVSPLDGRFHGWLGYTVYQANPKAKNSGKKAIDEIEQAIRLRPEDSELPFLLGTVYGDSGDARRSEKAFQAVLKINPRHEGALAELKGVTKRKRRKANKDGPEGEPQELGVAIALFFAVFALCFMAANMAGHDATILDPYWRGFGEKEYFYYHDNWWFWARRILILGAALFGVKVLLKEDEIESVRPVEFTILGFMFGTGYGFLSAFVAARQWPSDQDGALILPVAGFMLLMILFHAITEEMFFRRYLTRVVQRVIPNATAGGALSALLFGVYHMSYTAFYWGLQFWNPEFPAYSMPMQALSMAMTWGLPLALLFYWSRSLGPSLVANFMFGVTYMMISYFRASGAL